MPPSDATPADIAAVAAHLEGNPAPQAPAPEAPAATAQPVAQPVAQEPTAQMQPAPVANQPAPTSQPLDPFAAFMQPPAQPAPAEQPAPQEPVAQPTAQPVAQPTQPAQPAQPTAPEEQFPQIPGQSAQGEEQIQSYEDYMKSVTEGLEEAPAAPDPSKISPDDVDGIKGFFDELLSTAEQRFEAKFNRKQAIQAAERKLWDGAFDKYASLRDNKPLRDMVHSIRMGYFQRGLAITPVQAADKLLQSLGQQYKQGAADASVVSTIQQVQPQGGNTGAPIPTTIDVERDMVAVQDGGETALAGILEREIAAGRL